MNKATLLAAALLCACSTVTNGAHDGYTVAERHPIGVDQQTETLLVAVEPGANGLNRGQLASLDAFVSLYRTRGYGPLTVTTPQGGGEARAAGQTAADVRRALFAAGIPYEDMRGASVRSAQTDAVVVSFATYVASAPACGTSRGELVSRLKNRPHPNFGCANQANLAAMVADPRDLHEPTPADDRGDRDLIPGIAINGQ